MFLRHLPCRSTTNSVKNSTPWSGIHPIFSVPRYSTVRRFTSGFWSAGLFDVLSSLRATMIHEMRLVSFFMRKGLTAPLLPPSAALTGASPLPPLRELCFVAMRLSIESENTAEQEMSAYPVSREGCQ